MSILQAQPMCCWRGKCRAQPCARSHVHPAQVNEAQTQLGSTGLMASKLSQLRSAPQPMAEPAHSYTQGRSLAATDSLFLPSSPVPSARWVPTLLGRSPPPHALPRSPGWSAMQGTSCGREQPAGALGTVQELAAHPQQDARGRRQRPALSTRGRHCCVTVLRQQACCAGLKTARSDRLGPAQSTQQVTVPQTGCSCSHTPMTTWSCSSKAEWSPARRTRRHPNCQSARACWRTVQSRVSGAPGAEPGRLQMTPWWKAATRPFWRSSQCSLKEVVIEEKAICEPGVRRRCSTAQHQHEGTSPVWRDAPVPKVCRAGRTA